MQTELSTELKQVVGQSLELLGEAIRAENGEKVFGLVEALRQNFKVARQGERGLWREAHDQALQTLSQLKSTERFQVAHAFAISLEIINACENAFRSYRLQLRRPEAPEGFAERICYVLTAHPTESRSPECIQIFSALTESLVKIFRGQREIFRDEIPHLLRLALKNPVSRHHRPEVADEAHYIYSLALREDILDSLIENSRHEKRVRLRSWVGGDKDGHPGVNARVMLQSLSLSRQKLATYADRIYQNFLADLNVLPAASAKTLGRATLQQRALLKKIHSLKKGDGKILSRLASGTLALQKAYTRQVGLPSPRLAMLSELHRLFPALVVPLELRESATLIRAAAEQGQGPIAQMLKTVGQISQGASVRHYAAALVISTTESAADIQMAQKLLNKCLGARSTLPLIPLFESRHSLENAKTILTELLADKAFVARCHRDGNSQFEIMLGYSDSAKENGSLMSRVLIRGVLFSLETLLASKGLVPVFFHGSGGSVARGGGSLEEQVAWWPRSARKIFKVTMQGEMVYRSFSRAEIFNSQVHKILSNAHREPSPLAQDFHAPIKDFATQVSARYQKLVFDPVFLKVVEKSTPYTYLSELRIGSRPNKRGKSLGIDTLRAIPWVLCWTQIRALLPIWWGIGATWSESSAEHRKQLQAAFRADPFFSSFIKLLAFSLAKVDLEIWFSYLRHSTLEKTVAQDFMRRFEAEFLATQKCVQDITGEENLLWFRPWLKASIELRSTMIHPLNMAQIVALKTGDAALLRETVTGVASGMLTTG